MRLRRWLVPAGMLALMPACGSDTLEPGTIVIALLAPPTTTNQPTVELNGLITRTPAASGVAIVVTATKSGQVVSDTADAAGAFTLTVTLTANAQNQILVGATDASGSTATPETVVILHDSRAPQVSGSTPANQADGVAPASVVVQFDEPVVDGSATMAVSRQGTAVPGSTALSADGLSLTFTPSAAFAINAIFAVTVSGAEDSIGNSQAQPTPLCFVTGGGGISVMADATDDLYQAGTPPATLIPPDLLEIRMARVGGMIHTIAQFDTPRTLAESASNNIFMVFDFDVDADSATGFITLKDSLFTPNNVLPHSGTGAEYAIGVLTQAAATDSSFVLQYTGPLVGDATFFFVPSLCGPFVGVVAPEASLGGNIGSARLVIYADAATGAGLYADPAPDVGYFTLALAASVARGALAPLTPALQAGTVRRAFTLPRRPFPPRR